jgi:heme exporter protein D
MSRQTWLAMGIQTIVMLGGVIGFLFTNMATKEDIRRIETRLDRIEQNHLQHITQLHAQKATKQNTPE